VINDYLTEFAGLPVHEYDGNTGGDGNTEGGGNPEGGGNAGGGALPGASEVAWRIRYTNHENGARLRDFHDNFELFCDAVDTTQVTHLIVGWWDDEEYDVVGVLCDAAEDFPNLRALFLGDVLDWEMHITWIRQFDVMPLFEHFPLLEQFEVRGGLELRFGPLTNDRLRVLRFESGGLPGEVVRGVAASDLPALEHLDLWLGVSGSVDDLAPILRGERLPSLRRLGLQNATYQDELAAAVASAPVVARLESLALSMGALSDRGVEALLTGQPLTHLKELDLHHAFLSEPMVGRLRAVLPDVALDLTDATGSAGWLREDTWETPRFYIAVDE
jgi:hypothetical protein